MTPEEVKRIVEQALRDWHNFPWLPWIITVVVLAFAFCLSVYWGERWKNKATLKLLGTMTEIAASINANHELRTQLQIAALEERLKVHQDAYVWWRLLVKNCTKPKEGPETAFKCQEWWMEHCLYLSGDVRDALYQCYWAAFGHAELLREPRDGDIDKAVKEREENWQRIMRAGEIILGSVSLLAMPDEKSLTPKELSPPKQ